MNKITKTQLNSSIFSVLARVKGGEAFEITETDTRSKGRPTKAIARIVPSGSCEWKQMLGGEWRAACGGGFWLGADGTPSDCGMKYCCYCGMEIRENGG